MRCSSTGRASRTGSAGAPDAPLRVLGEQVRLEPLAERAGRGTGDVVVDEHVAAAVADAPRVPGPGEVPDPVAVRPRHHLVDEVVVAGVLADLVGDHRYLRGHRADL